MCGQYLKFFHNYTAELLAIRACYGVVSDFFLVDDASEGWQCASYFRFQGPSSYVELSALKVQMRSELRAG